MDKKNLTSGGAKRKATKPVKTDKVHKDKCRTVRKVYQKNGKYYIKKRSAKTGKFGFYNVKL